MAVQLPATRLVYVADREADLVPLMLRAQALGTPADWLVRAKHNRCLPDGDKLWDHTGAGAPMGELTFAMAARHGVKAHGAPAVVGTDSDTARWQRQKRRRDLCDRARDLCAGGR